MATQIIRNMSRNARRELLESMGGKFYSARWITKDGTEAVRNCKHMQHHLFTLGHASRALDNPMVKAGREEYYTCTDTAKDGWVNINLDTLQEIKCGSTHILFQ